MFILEKVDPGSLSDADEIAHYQKTQDVLTDIKQWLRNQQLNGNEFLEYLNLKSCTPTPNTSLADGMDGALTAILIQTDINRNWFLHLSKLYHTFELLKHFIDMLNKGHNVTTPPADVDFLCPYSFCCIGYYSKNNNIAACLPCPSRGMTFFSNE